nr:hypothetical protein [Nitrosomonas nitrosa]
MKLSEDDKVFEAVARLEQCSFEQARAKVLATVDWKLKVARHSQVVAMKAQITAERISAQLEEAQAGVGLDDDLALPPRKPSSK